MGLPIVGLIIRRYMLKEIGITFIGVTLLLMLIFVSGTFVRILAEAAEGDYPVKVVLSLFALKSVGSIVLVLPISLFLGVMLALGRLYKDSEMVAMTACAIGPEHVMRAVALVAGIIAALVALLALYVGPWAEEMSHRLLDEAQAKVEIEGIVPGRFNQSESGDELLYAASAGNKPGELLDIFAHQRKNGKLTLLSAESAYTYRDKKSGHRYLMLRNGYRYEGTPGTSEYRTIHFEEHGVLLQTQEVVASKRRRNAIPSDALLRSSEPADTAELQWRIATPISALLLALLAVPLSKTNPRSGRFGRLFIGIMLFVIYNNLLSVARSAVSKGEVSPWIGMWWPHLLVAVLVYLLYTQQSRMRSPKVRAAA
jgi:lipopolysaccharide export system permease protein